MMKSKEIKIFQSITTEEAILELEAESKKYEGLYVDMDNAPERKYVKDKAVLISGLLKKLDRARIDESKNYKLLVEAEASSIKDRLEEANKPFTLLIDKHKAKRAKELAIEKKIEEQKELAAQKEVDHENAIMEDKARMFEKAEAELERVENERKLVAEAEKAAKEKAEKDAQDAVDRAEREAVESGEREEAARKQAEESERLRLEAIEQQKISDKIAEERRIETARQAKIDVDQAAENAKLAEIERQKQEEAEALAEQARREANTKHKGAINTGILDVLVSNGISVKDAKRVITLAAKKQLPNLTINY